MSIVHSLRLRNLRSLKDTGYINVKPITVLVGKNSAGKSTFARTLPLLRQSSEEDKRSPVLWYGRLVDFGSFDTAVNKNSPDKSIEFGFDIDLKNEHEFSFIFEAMPLQSKYDPRLIHDTIARVNIQIRPTAATKSSFASKVTIEMFGNLCEVVFTDSSRLEKIKVNKFEWASEGTITRVQQGKILPKYSIYKTATRKIDGAERKIIISINPFHEQLQEALMTLAHKNTTNETIKSLTRSLTLSSEDALLQQIRKIPNAPTSVIKHAKFLTPTNPIISKINNLIYAAALPSLIEKIDNCLASYLSEVRYIEPLRATAQRYYRRQELAVDEIDSKGTNIAMFIDNLSPQEQGDLNTWLSDHFNINVHAENTEGHIALAILKGDTKNQHSTNMADLGVGFSQLLPIVIQLWTASQIRNPRQKRFRSEENSCIIIEQPELHLHPAYQAQISDVITAALMNAKANNRSLTTILETHSPHLINRLGQLIEEGILPKDSVQVVLFNQEDEDEYTTVSISDFDENGVLTNWPYGFFEPQ